MKRLILTLMRAGASFAPLSFAAWSTLDKVAVTQQAPVITGRLLSTA
jgi:hypothetical protein